MAEKNIFLHFIEEKTQKLRFKKHAANVPRVGDECRFGGEGNEIYFEVTRIVWVYDEENSPFDRANIGIKRLD